MAVFSDVVVVAECGAKAFGWANLFCINIKKVQWWGILFQFANSPCWVDIALPPHRFRSLGGLLDKFQELEILTDKFLGATQCEEGADALAVELEEE